jgi:hypothetical protein
VTVQGRHQRLRPHRPQLLPRARRASAGRRHRDRRSQRPDGQRTWRTCSSTTRSWAAALRRERRRRLDRQRQEIKALAEKDPAAAAVGRPGRRHRDRVHRLLHRQGTKAQGHIDAGAKKVLISAPAKRRGHHHRHGRQRRQVRPGQPQRHLQRLLHHQLPRADGQGAQRRVRHRQGPDDHDPRLHPGPEPAGRPAQGPAPRPRRRPQHDPDLHRCRQGHRPGAARAEGQARRLRDARADPDRLGHRPHLRLPAARPPPKRSTRSSRPPPKAR